MGRIIVKNRTQLEANNGDSKKPDEYLDKLIKYVPAETVSAWIAIKGIILSSAKPEGTKGTTDLWVLFIILIVLTSVYLYRTFYKQIKEQSKSYIDKPRKVKLSNDHYIQILISTLAFIVWVFATGEPFSSLSFYQPYYASITIIIFTFVIPMI